jgi:hypothetical protein
MFVKGKIQLSAISCQLSAVKIGWEGGWKNFGFWIYDFRLGRSEKALGFG